jgi:hypothetical protein
MVASVITAAVMVAVIMAAAVMAATVGVVGNLWIKSWQP